MQITTVHFVCIFSYLIWQIVHIHKNVFVHGFDGILKFYEILKEFIF